MMQIKRLAMVVILATVGLYVSPVYAAESAVLAAPMQRVANEYAGHSEHGGMSGMHTGMGKPTAWTSFPTLKTRMSGKNREAVVITVVPQNIVADRIDVYSNNLKDENARRQLPMEMDGAKLDKPASGGFQILTAREEQPGTVHVASTVYYFGERGAKNPTSMFLQQKHELEIIPQPFPREHSRYRANEDWHFLVRFNGKYLPNHNVVIETQNGSKAQLNSDAQGVITLHVPDDFKREDDIPTGDGHNHGRRGSEFVLATEYVTGDKTYLSAFNSSYAPDAFDQRNLAMGMGFTFLGMMSAVPLLRQRKADKKTASGLSVTASQTEES